MVWGLLAVISLNLVDTYFIAKLGGEELAAMSFSLPIVLLLMSLSLGLSIGAGSVISRAIGSGDYRRVKMLTTSSLTLTFGIMVLFTIIGISSIDLLFKVFNASPEVLAHIHSYMEVWYIGLPAMGLAMVGNTVMTSSGDVRLPAGIMIFVALLNFIMDPVLIFGLYGFPRLEMGGAALATTLSYIIAFLISFWGIAIKKKMLTVQINAREMLKSWNSILEISLPAVASQMIVPITSAVTVWMLSHFGSSVVGGYGIVSRLEAFSLIVVVGLSNCIAPIVGQNWGAQLYDRANQSVTIAYKFALAWGVTVALVLAIGYKFIPEFFINDPVVVSTVSLYLLSVPISYGAVGCLFITNAYLNAIGMSSAVAMITIIRHFVLYLPLSLLAMRHFGPKGIFLVISFVNILMGLGAYLWAKRRVVVYTQAKSRFGKS